MSGKEIKKKSINKNNNEFTFPVEISIGLKIRVFLRHVVVST